MHAELPLASFVCATLVLIPLPWHWRAGTVATVSISIWLFISNMINGINAILWANNINITVPIWCDITTKLLLGCNLALPASVFCLCVHLERVSSVREVQSSHSQRRKRQVFDATLCFIIPIIYMALHYIVQGHRFDIVEDFGCRVAIYVSIPSIFIIWLPPMFFSLGSFILSALSFRHFWQRRIIFARHLRDANSALTPSRYFRLMSMALVQMLWSVIIISLNMWFTLKNGLRPWTNFGDVHVGFSRVGLFPTLFIPPQQLTYTYLLWWTIPMSSLFYFVFFAFGQDAMKEYRSCLSWINQRIISPLSCSAAPPKSLRTAFDLRRKAPLLPSHVEINVSIAHLKEGGIVSPAPSSTSFPSICKPCPTHSAHSLPKS